MSKHVLTVALLALGLGLGACIEGDGTPDAGKGGTGAVASGDGDGDGDAPGDGDGDGDVVAPTPDAGASERVLSGRVFGALDQAPRAGVRVRVGDLDATTDADGSFSLTLGLERGQLMVDGDGLAHQQQSVPAGDRPLYYEVYASPVGPTRDFDPANGVQVRLPGGGEVYFAPGVLSNSQSATAQARLTPVDPSVANQRRGFPVSGPTRGDTGSGILDANSAMDITVASEGGELNINAGNQARVRFPARGKNPSQRRRLFSFDETTGRWVDEGAAQLTRNRAGQPVYEAAVRHLSWWSVGDAIEQLSCVRACVRGADDTPAAGVRVTAAGVDYAGESVAYAGADGCFALDLPRGAQVQCEALTLDGLAAPGVFQVPTTAVGADDDPGACADWGTWRVARREAGACPSARAACDDVCVDLLSDATHCGGCGDACGAGLDCVDGRCGCAATEQQCGDSGCVDPMTDSEHCGACDNACAAGQLCEAGACVALDCETGRTDCGGVCVDLAVDGIEGKCPAPTGAACEPGLLECGAECVSDTEDVRHCGACGQACAGAAMCVAGECREPLQCEPGFSDCGGATCTDRRSDSNNCGACGLVCAPPNGTGSCQAGACVVDSCNANFLDLDSNAANGCEYACAQAPGAEVCDGLDNDCNGAIDESPIDQSIGNACGSNDIGVCAFGAVACVAGALSCQGAIEPALVEQCDGLDDDCDGRVDEDYAFFGDVNNCGGCGRVCSAGGPNTLPYCVEGTCQTGSCVGGWRDADGDWAGNGCEVCLASPPGAEVCNGLDDNCDGVADEGDVCSIDG